MLWRQFKPSYRRLLREGAQGEAVIVHVEVDDFSGVGRGGDPYYDLRGWNVTVRVVFDDGSTAELERYVKNYEYPPKGFPALEPGDTLPIRYDPNDHSRVEIDKPAL